MSLNIKSRLSSSQKRGSTHEKMGSRLHGNDGAPWLWFIGLYFASLLVLGSVMFLLRHLVFLLP